MGEAYSITLHIPPLSPAVARKLKVTQLPVLQADVMQRWQRKRYREVWRHQVALARQVAGPLPQKPLTSAQVVGIRYCCGTQPDRQNVWYSFKPLTDGLIAAGLILDDNPSVLVAEDYYAQPVKTRAEQRIELSVVGIQRNS